MNAFSAPREFWIDVGGTFTDCIALMPDRTLRVHKILSTGTYKGAAGRGSTKSVILDPQRRADPAGFFEGFAFSCAAGESSVSRFDPLAGAIRLARPLRRDPLPGEKYELRSPEEAPIAGIRWLMGVPLSQPLGEVSIRLGTTKGTNALLEKTGARTLLVTTAGFGDVLLIANQDRPRLFDLNVRKPVPLFGRALELRGRIGADGREIEPFDAESAADGLLKARADGFESAAICLLNSYLNPAHELAAATIASEAGFAQVSVSSRLSPLQKIVSRGDTTVVDAYLGPVIRGYVASLSLSAPMASIRLMNSAGGLNKASSFVGKDSVLSGPAGGVVGFARVAARAGFLKAIGFDMGGTSTDVSRFDGEYERRYEMEVNDPESGTGVRITAPMLSIETVAAGGGSICSFDGIKPVVGPKSAGADPGPACYGKGGPATVTDADLVLGRIAADKFPFPLDEAAARAAIAEVASGIAAATGVRYGVEELADGFRRIADANMAAPVKKIAVSRGIDLRDYALVSFGGAGGQHACSVARNLGIRKVLVSPMDGVLSAFGIGSARDAAFGERHVGRTLSDATLEAASWTAAAHGSDLAEKLVRDGSPCESVTPARVSLDLRYEGQQTSLTLPWDGGGEAAVRASFEERHRAWYGFAFPERRVEVQALRVEVDAGFGAPDIRIKEPAGPGSPLRNGAMWLEGARVRAPVFARESLPAGFSAQGPALVVEGIGAIVVEPGWTITVTPLLDLLLEDTGSGPEPAAAADADDPVTLEIFNNLLASVASQMGAVLQRTAVSVNVKERLDFSCAIFDSGGELAVNAPHIPVHLGGLSDCVKMLLKDEPVMKQGDVFVTNDPYRGGSHLPDVTVITPVFAGGQRPEFFAASRAHHAEIGGIAPGSMPAFSKVLGEEGVVIRHFRLVEGDRSGEERLRQILSSGEHPSRCPSENVADVNAQAAANRLGASLMAEAVGKYGLDRVTALMGGIRRAAAEKMRRALSRFEPGERVFADRLDDGSPIRVSVRIFGAWKDGPAAEVDFTGTAPVLGSNLNANAAIVRSAVLYVFRCLIDDDIPLNGGVLDPVRIVLPECFLNPVAAEDHSRSPAVAGGNVETSQRIVDALIGALGVAAAGQGTMNNLSFGNARFGYYETIAGGGGAGPGFRGADAVHVHMTNTRITDAEVLEARYPVRLRRFAIRRGSGGAGKFRGGDGVVREIEFLEPVDVSLLTQRRVYAPFGGGGGGDGAMGRNSVSRAGGPFEDLPGICALKAEAGDVLRIETPGGGGWGAEA